MSHKIESLSSRKPEPLLSAPPAGKICPVCGKRSYSLRGIHPQCAVQQADAPRQALLLEEKRERTRSEAERRQAEAS
jgi:hypothetical protein